LCVGIQDAARLRDQVKELEELNKPQPPDMTGITTESDTVTHGVRVKVRRCASSTGDGTSTALMMAKAAPEGLRAHCSSGRELERIQQHLIASCSSSS
jgi:hypothetical protein